MFLTENLTWSIGSTRQSKLPLGDGNVQRRNIWSNLAAETARTCIVLGDDLGKQTVF